MRSIPLETESLVERLTLLGLECQEAPPDRITSAIAALACYPMYMVANVHAWTSESQFHLPVLDLPGIEAIVEAIELGRQEGAMPASIDSKHSRALGMLNRGAKASDRIIYEYAIDTLRRFLDTATPAVAERLRTAVARSIVRVAEAAGKGLFSGTAVSPEERACIQHINLSLGLDHAPAAVEAFKELDD